MADPTLIQALRDPEFYKEMGRTAANYGKTGLSRLLRGEALLTGKPIVESLKEQMTAPATQTAMDWAAPGVGHLGGALAAHTAWHGSPHIFDKFDLAKIGTGEGAQAYGHGVYLAEAPEVAQGYAKNLSGDFYKVGNELFDPLSLKHLNVKAELRKSGLDAAIQRAKQAIANDESGIGQAALLAKRDLATLETIKAKGGLSPAEGQFYKIDIPDEHIARMLDWDKPLSEQSPEIQQYARQFVQPELKISYERPPVPMQERHGGISNPDKHLITMESPDGQLVWGIGDTRDAAIQSAQNEFLPKTGEQLYQAIARKLDSTGQLFGRGSQAASESLFQAGIPGIKYLDAGSRGAGEGTRNFVMFNPEDIRILERNAAPTGQVPWNTK